MNTASLIQTDRFVLSTAEQMAIEHEMQHYEHPRAASIEALKIVQKARGWIPDGAAEAIGAVLGIPAAEIEGVATFYSQIFRQPVGRHVIRVCDSMTCFIAGHEDLLRVLHVQLGISVGQTTADQRFTLLPVCCLGNCDKAPALMIDEQTFGNIHPNDLERILEAYP